MLYLLEDRLLRLGLELTEDVGRVVVLQLLDDLGGALRAQGRERLLRVGILRQLGQRLAGELGGKRLHHGQAFVLVQRG